MENAPFYVVSLYIMIFKNVSVALKDASVSSKFAEVFGALPKVPYRLSSALIPTCSKKKPTLVMKRLIPVWSRCS